MGADRTAALPMYDFPELREAHDTFWGALAERLVAAGLTDVPPHLTRSIGHFDVWRDPELLLAQGCEFPLAKYFSDRVRLVATPLYDAEGCTGNRYRSAIIVRADEPAVTLADLRGRRCAINEKDSNSGMNLLRAAVAPLAGGQQFFESVTVTGSHRASTEMVASGGADVAAIDCVSFAHFGRLYPDLVAGLRVLTWTASSPALPFITRRSANGGAASCDEVTVQALRAALVAVCEDDKLAPVRGRLLLKGVDVHPVEGFGEVLQLESDAVRAGYPAIW